MVTKRIYDREGHAHFVTFSCYRRRRLLDHDRARRVVLGVRNSQLCKQSGWCVGFVLMPDHVHAIVGFPNVDQISHFMKQWKQRSSVHLKRLFAGELASYGEWVASKDPVWQSGYYGFNLYTEEKVAEKLTYMHQNPVRAGLVGTARDWQWSSARFYEENRSVGVPVGWPS